MLALLANWRLIAAGASVAALLAGGAYVVHLRHSADQAKAVAHAAQVQSATDKVTTQAVDHYTTEVRIVHDRASQAVDQIQQTKVANDALDPAFRDSLCAGLGLVRDRAVCTPDNGAK